LDFLRGEGGWKELQVLAEELNCDVMGVADFEMNVYDTQPGCVGGAREEFVFASRLDNLASSFCALWALLDTCREPSSLLDESGIHMVALFDSGEVMSLQHIIVSCLFSRDSGIQLHCDCF
jgi:aspartyl aminopeptidase